MQCDTPHGPALTRDPSPTINKVPQTRSRQIPTRVSDPAHQKVVTYYRVSTRGQQRSGLGLEAQRESVTSLCDSRGWKILAEYTETESGNRNDRPELTKALEHCGLTGARLVVAKLDRLSRNLTFLSQLQDGDVPFVCADMPEANEFTIDIMAAMAKHERQMISRRTREALAAAKARGVKLGNPNGAAAFGGKSGQKKAVEAKRRLAQERAQRLAPVIDDLRKEGRATLKALADGLNERGIATARGGQWGPKTVARVLRRIDQPTV